MHGARQNPMIARSRGTPKIGVNRIDYLKQPLNAKDAEDAEVRRGGEEDSPVIGVC